MRLGATVPLSGPLEAYGRAQQSGMQQAVDAMTEEGQLQVGALRRPVELDVRDDGGDSDVAAQWLLQLVRRPDPVTALIAPCSASAVEVRVAEARQVPLVSGCAPGDAAQVAQTWSWQVGATPAERAAAVIGRLRSAAPVALLATAGQPLAAFQEAAAAAGVTLLGPYGPGDDQWRTAARTAAAQGARGILALTEAPTGRALWPALAAVGLRPSVAFAAEAALPGPWPDTGPAVVLTDGLGPLPSSPEAAVAAAAAEATRALLEAVRTAGDDRPLQVREALAEQDLARPYSLARRTGDRLVAP